MIVLNEKEFSEKCLENGLMGNKPYFVISILAKYYYHNCGYRKRKISTFLLEYLSEYYPRYELDEFDWQLIIEKIAAKAGKYPLFEISGVSITQSELDTIEALNNKILERLLFTMLCLAKLNNKRNPANNGWVNTDTKDIFSYARISCKSIDKEIKIGELWQKGLIEFSKRNDNLNCRITFINENTENDKEVMFISDFRELGYEYLNYKGQNFIRCAECGILTRGNKAGTKKYCKDCAAYTPQDIKKVICVDCGKEFTIEPKSRVTRCVDCRVKERRRIEREQKRKQRTKY